MASTIQSSLDAHAVDRGLTWFSTDLPDGTNIPAGDLVPDTVLEERSEDESVITEQPVEAGSTTSDHAYDLPQNLELTYAWSAAPPNGGPVRGESFIADTYAQILQLKSGKVLCGAVAGKRQYKNLLIKSVAVTTDKDSEYLLLARISLKQILFTYTQSGTVTPASQMAFPEKTMPTANNGLRALQPAPNFNGGSTGSTPLAIPFN
jgi:hypothetical protein